MWIHLKSLLGGIVGGLLGYGLRLILYFSLNRPPYYHFRILSVLGLGLTVLGFIVGYSLVRGRIAAPTVRSAD
jgi:ABC-type antimicrobial peptide transport system permease subunit